MAELEYLWNKYDGHGDFRIDPGLATVVQKLAENLDIRTEWVVKSINYEASDEIKITNQRGETLVAQRVVVAVPVTVLQDNDIQFTPSLPKYKIEALGNISKKERERKKERKREGERECVCAFFICLFFCLFY